MGRNKVKEKGVGADSAEFEDELEPDDLKNKSVCKVRE
jgi:hypothetical protein